MNALLRIGILKVLFEFFYVFPNIVNAKKTLEADTVCFLDTLSDGWQIYDTALKEDCATLQAK